MLMIVWDEAKRQTNLAKHGLDFADLDEGFFLASVVIPAKGGRHMAIGCLADGTIAVVFVTLGTEVGFSDLNAPGQPEGKEPAMTGKRLTEKQIQRMIASDPDAPEATDDQLAQARPFTEAFPALAKAMRKNVGGRPKAESPKVAVSLRLDHDVVARFKASGPGWQTRMNNALRDAAGL